MNNVGMRDIESAVVRARPEPIAPVLPERGPQSDAPLPRGKIFAADVPQGEDAWGLEAALRPLVELAAHRDTEAPLTIGFLGGAGSGKSFALGALLGQIEALQQTATDRGPFLKRIAIVRIEASRLDGDTPVGLAELLYEALGGAFPDMVRDAADAVRDPRAVVREVGERLDNGRRRLDAERQSLVEIESRRARIFETVLFETAGSKIDAYARANRSSIESRLEGFGITGDPILNFKSMVRDLAESSGPIARVGAALRTIWAFKGQMRLLIVAVVLWLVGLGLAAAVDNQAVWLGWLQNANASLAPTVAWVGAHVDWLVTLKHVAYAAAALALASNVVRGMRFVQPMFRGIALLDSDVAAKRRDLDGLYAHQMRRVDGLAAEVERIAQQAAQAERRMGNHGGRADAHLEPSPFDTGSLKMRAERFFASLGRALHRPDRGPVAMADIHKTAPERVIIALDNLDALAPDAAWNVLDAAHRALAQPGFVLLLALDSARLADAQGEIRQRLDKWIQVPFRVGPNATDPHGAGLVAQIIGRGGRAAGDRKAEAAAREVGIDWAISDAEAALLAELAPIAGPSPRTVKRFVNLYRVVRSQAPEIKTALALRLALDLGGDEDERAAAVAVLAEPAAEPAAEAELYPARFGPRIAKALRDSGRFDVEAFRKADEIVRRYSLHG